MINENILRVNININQTLITILGIYAILDDEPSTTKYEFFEKVNNIIIKIEKMRDNARNMNNKVDRRTNNKIIDLYSEANQNDNGERLIQVCQNYLLKITNGF